MTDNLSKVMEKINIKKAKAKVPEVEDVEEVEDDEEEEEVEEDDEEEEAEVEKKPVTKVKKAKKTLSDEELQEQKAREIEILQNNGVWRSEMLFQLNQINQSLLILNSQINKAIESGSE